MVRRQFVHRKHQEPQKKSDDSWILQRSAVRRVPAKTQESQKSKDSWILQRSAVHEVPAKNLTQSPNFVVKPNLRQPSDFVVKPNLRQPPDFVVKPNLRQPPDFVVKPNKGIQADLTKIPVRNYSETPFQPRMRSHLQVKQLVAKDKLAAQQKKGRSTTETPVQRQEDKRETENKTGLPDHIKEGIESLSGYDLSGVRVNYNSAKPAQLKAHAYTQGQSIEVAPGQERHVPHEAWHVVQQMQGRVKEEFKMKGLSVNSNRGLEREADVMGKKAIQKQEHQLEASQPNSILLKNQETKEVKANKKKNLPINEQPIQMSGSNDKSEKLFKTLNNSMTNQEQDINDIFKNNSQEQFLQNKFEQDVVQPTVRNFVEAGQQWFKKNFKR
ncbi:hypothetical protein BJP34_11825 [Moorena producens PAL-8-15-08-1]|uniref:eCIS core domain-containing protein n=1 Tax=Moorena producens PAL-8-15-08-1 TaxID=1458985 RepID=A0A1D8TR49_9CYAN|nr:DUF4157 domain-containing protein [Moorena producens]AOX00054.1 hypothetical protein BJP34_11825 [Moorena producens PAL-8-15-08-1]